MMSQLFEEELISWNQKLQGKCHKILLMLDYCPAYLKIEHKLSNIKLVFLSPNTTIVLQPKDRGVIWNLKCHYRKLILIQVIQGFENRGQNRVSLLDAIRCLSITWNQFMPETIGNCFHHTKFLDAATSLDSKEPEWYDEINTEIISNAEGDATIYSNNDIITSATNSDADILVEVQEEASNYDDMENGYDNYKEFVNLKPVPMLNETIST
ncbi:tigger transposable element-derived protein 2-like [Centruroides sculpturatus]|uniref:tigger transposable element-derived protein 2-like n=1 Tax=Centruroides sculpturatus TaxID=218467 RepID=UPI000C6EA2E1|nr:tigger transposable element-derived protein 2-like [Centruroides sculpturatus]